MPKVTMPQLGESVAEGTIGKWLKQVGDHVDKYEPIVEVITDKVNAEVPSPFAGTLTEILVKEGDTVPNHAEIAVIDGAGVEDQPAEAAAPAARAVPATPPAAQVAPAPAPAAQLALETSAPAAPAAAASVSVAAPASASAQPTVLGTGGYGPAGSDERAVEDARQAALGIATNGSSAEAVSYEGRMTPAVRRIAREHGVDLALVHGTGHGGRITREDVLRYVDAGRAAAVQAAPPGPSAQPAPSAAAQPVAAVQPGAVAQPVVPTASPVAQGDSLKQASPMRRAIAAQMTRALQVPVAFTTIEVDMSAVVRLRESLKRDYQAREGIGLSYVAFVTKASVEALRRHAEFNAHYTDEGHWLRRAVNVGVAVAVADGLVVPVIKNADGLSIHGLNRQIYDLAERARSGRLRLDDVQGGTFTVDNTGWTGSVLTQPIINVPEVAILTMEAIVKRPVVIEQPDGDVIGIRPIMNMCLGFDHRATDGAQAGTFVGDIKRWLESVDAGTSVW